MSIRKRGPATIVVLALVAVLAGLLPVGAGATPTGVLQDPPSAEARSADTSSEGPAPREVLLPGAIQLDNIGSYPELPVVPPPNSPLMDPAPIKRDCGFSVPLNGGRTLWLYCDTTNNYINSSGQYRFNYFYTSSAAIAYDNKPLEVREAYDDSGNVAKPYPFLSTPSGYWPCPNKTDWHHVMWPNSATLVPGLGGKDRVLVWYTNLCRPKGAGSLEDYVQKSIGLAEWIHDPSDPAPHTKPIQAKVLVNDLFPIESDSEGSWGEAAFYNTDLRVYVFRCVSDKGCYVGRVVYWQVTDPKAHEYWNGSTWVVGKNKAAPVPMNGPPPMSAFNVTYLPDMGVYAMSGFAPPGAYHATVHVRVAPSLVGPWGPAESFVFPMCKVVPGCYAGHVHPQLSGPDSITLSAYHWAHYHERGGQVITMKSRVYLDPPVPGLCQSGFFDVGYDHLFCEEIKWFGTEGITSGYVDGSYKPTLRVSRQVMAQWFHNWHGNPPVPPGAPTFTDVPKDHLFHDAIRWAAAEGITQGYPDGTFRPRNTVGRQTMAAWFYRLADSPEGPFPNPGFTDVPTSHIFYNEIAWFAELGITKGYPDGTFRPGEGVSRQGVAAFFYRYTGQG